MISLNNVGAQLLAASTRPAHAITNNNVRASTRRAGASKYALGVLFYFFLHMVPSVYVQKVMLGDRSHAHMWNMYTYIELHL